MRYSEPSDQTAMMRQVNLVIAVRACHFVCFVILLLDCRVLFAHSFWAGESKLRIRWLTARTLPRPPLHKPVFAFHFLLSTWTYTAEV